MSIQLRLIGALVLTLLIAFCVPAEAGALLLTPEGVAGGLALAAIAPFPVDPDLMAVAMGYKNQGMIADEVLPRVPVNNDKYSYYVWDIAEGYTVPDTKVGRRSAPNQVEFSATEKSGLCLDYGLDDPIPQKDLDNAPQGINPRARAVEGIMDLIALDREVRVANLVFNAATYKAGLKETLSGASQFSDPGSDPIGVISDALDKPIMRPNVMVLGQSVWTRLRQHPALVKAFNGTAGDSGMVPREFVTNLFELDDLVVGQAFVNNARKGQAPTFQRTWGKHVALIHRNRLADPSRSGSRITFGFTAQHGTAVAGSVTDSDIGLRGGERVRAGETVDEHIVANDVAYFIENAIA